MLESVKHLMLLAVRVTLGAVTLGAVTLGAVTLGDVTLGAVTLGIGLLDFLGNSLLV